jgi:hypothetical protein
VGAADVVALEVVAGVVALEVVGGVAALEVPKIGSPVKAR